MLAKVGFGVLIGRGASLLLVYGEELVWQDQFVISFSASRCKSRAFAVPVNSIGKKASFSISKLGAIRRCLPLPKVHPLDVHNCLQSKSMRYHSRCRQLKLYLNALARSLIDVSDTLDS